jgi:hypothetical protein
MYNVEGSATSVEIKQRSDVVEASTPPKRKNVLAVLVMLAQGSRRCGSTGNCRSHGLTGWKKRKTSDDGDTPGSTGALTVSCSGRAHSRRERW